ncbi:erythromycin esterase family protein [Flindersiella endophytica]
MPDADITAWIRRNAHSPADVEPLRRITGDAAVVGLGESAHGAHELFTTKHRMLVNLVEHLGFRAVGWEEDEPQGRRLDAYVTTGAGDLRELLRDSIVVWRTTEILGVLEWMRAYNLAHPDDPVRFVGADVQSSPEFRACPPEQRFAHRDQKMAENLLRWHEQTGSKLAYWAHNVHVADDRERMSTGAHLRARFGEQYVAIATCFGHGSVNQGVPGWWEPRDVPPPRADFADDQLPGGTYLLDLRSEAPDTVRTWLTAPALLRAIGPTYDPGRDASHNMTNGTLGGWFDAIARLETVTPSRRLEEFAQEDVRSGPGGSTSQVSGAEPAPPAKETP